MQINLISDTVTKPTEGMLKAMMNAEVGDDVFKSDPTVNKLQHKIAEMFDMEDALFFPSGTMANQTAIKIHTHHGDKMFCDKYAHVHNFEGGGAAASSGVTSHLLDGKRGTFTAKQLEEAVVGDRSDIHSPYARLVALENTTNKGGGACWDFEEILKIRKVCDTNNLALHLDGARLFNALVAKKESPEQYGNVFDTISICLSKGLGAPVGSLLLGSKDYINKALRVRKIFGGGMRQAGYLAAAGIYALDNHIERLEVDHSRAKIIGTALKNCELVKKVEPIETNIIIFNIIDGINDEVFINRLNDAGIGLISMGQGKLRMVTHLDFNEEMLRSVVNTINHI
ncbi:aminotransferase class I/II-fold pyridoxal phosphate-dependent enzyme [Lutibacter sp. A80]|uniref:threonine aldolase family protein n=1 Tax=Lutibacter sp. A80 TaxID=2918453 RepID=UPI001F0681B1|nr:GntG family PLP-dependent aldolase [Lutibacter sp. A80]UMB61464.1 aminotransferase class I/II-fold pyridoxal phosphate-dependent enzyme [Lutibacter sp. A80]